MFVPMLPLLLPAAVVNAAGDGGKNGTCNEVYVAGPPTALAGIADPTPLLVNGVGMSKVEVFGTSLGLSW